MAWIENRGQWATDALFVAQTSLTLLRAEPSGISLHVQGGGSSGRDVFIRMMFEGMSEQVSIEPEIQVPGAYHYFLGNEPSRWYRDVHGYQRVRYRGIYPGVDLVLGEEGGKLKYDLEFAPGFDPSQIVVRCEGAQGLRLDDHGSLCIDTDIGTLVQPRGTTWQVLPSGVRREVSCHYEVLERGAFRFDVSEWDPKLPLVIDPDLKWASYVGSTTNPFGTGDVAFDADIESNGNVTVTGITGATDFPTTPGTFQSVGLGHNIFVTRLRGSDGSLIYSSVIGGSHTNDRVQALCVDEQGRATVTGWTSSSDFPTTSGSFMPLAPGGAFVLRLTPSGDDLEFSTYLGGTLGAEAYAVTLAASGSAIVGGVTVSSDFPTSNTAYDRTYAGMEDAFVTRFDPTGSSIEWSTYLGRATGPERVLGLAVDAQDQVTATGYTQSPTFPTTPGAFDRMFDGTSP